MLQPDISVIRAVQSERISRDVMARVRPEVAPRGGSISAVRAIRRSVGHSIVRVGERIQADTPAEVNLRLAR